MKGARLRSAYILLLLCAQLLHWCDALIVSAPDACGGTHVIKHASAMFGPPAKDAHVRDVTLFAPRPQAHGMYLRLPSGDGVPTTAAGTVRVVHVARHHRPLLPPLFGPPATTGLADAAPVQMHTREADGMTTRPSSSVPSDASSPTPMPVPPPVPRSLLSLVVPFSNPIVTRSEGVSSDPAHQTSRSYHTPSQAQPAVRYPSPAAAQLDQLADRPTNEVPTTHTVEHAAAAHDSAKNESVLEEGGSYAIFNSCIPLSVASDIEAVHGRVAVVSRGVCDFSRKVTLMQDAGAVAVIVVNLEVSGDKIIVMKLNDSKADTNDIHIPSVMISYSSWMKIAPCSNSTTVVFSGEGENPPNSDPSRDALNWAMMRGMALWILCQCGVNVVRYKRRVSEFRARADAIAALPVNTYERRGSGREGWQPTDVGAEGEEREGADTSSAAVDVATSNGTVVAATARVVEPDDDSERASLIQSEPSASTVTSSASAARGIVAGTSSSPSTSAMASSSSSAIPPLLPSSSSAVSRTAGLHTLGDEDSFASTSSGTRRAPEAEESDEDDGVCAICLEEFENGEQVRVLACSHLYHRCCIDPWLQSSSNCCPLCKREVPNLPPPPTQLHYGSMIV